MNAVLNDIQVSEAYFKTLRNIYDGNIFAKTKYAPLVIHVSQSHIIKVTLSKPPVFAISAYNATLSKDFLKSKIGKDSTFEGKIMTVLQSHLNLR